MTQEEIKLALAQLYRVQYDMYVQLETLAREAAQDGDNEGFRGLHREATDKAYVLYGIRIAAQALGIERDEFVEEVNLD